MFVEIAVAIPSEKTFTYAVPGRLSEGVVVGKRVLVPFGKKRLTGYVVGISLRTDRDEVKEILEVLDTEPLFNEENLTFYRWAANYYLYPLGKALGEILPGGINVDSDRWVCLESGSVSGLSGGEKQIVEILKNRPSGISVRNLKKETASRKVLKDLERLREQGVIRMEEKMARPAVSSRKEKFISVAPGWSSDGRLSEKAGTVIGYLAEKGEVPLSGLRREFQTTSEFIRRLEGKGAVVVQEREVYRSVAPGPDFAKMGAVTLNSAQQAASREIHRGLKSARFSPYLLHGVTGSGKTEVYFSALHETIRLGGSALFLVPEIALTPQLLSRIRERFADDDIAVLHSGVPKAVRYDQWRRIRRGDVRIVVGARSALFAPARNLKLIIVDEEHDASYKQDERMPYNARDLAVVRARFQEAAIILGSATPGLQSYFNAKHKKYHYLGLPDRAGEKRLPEVEILDMRKEREKKGKSVLLSGVLLKAIGDTLDAGKQVLLFLNRRGFHTFLFCADCGYVLRCLNCSVSLTHHAGHGILKCHHCDFAVKAPPVCPSCGGGRVRNYGAGTERLEEEISRTFPEARVGRMDSDTTAGRGIQEKILQSLDRGKIDILIGTQMITKGHDYPNVLLVGVIMADASLNIPDFRAAENTFQLLTQVAGRGGRGDDPGRVIIQTYNPENYAIRLAREQNYPGFYEEEIALRETLGYPPHSRMINLRISGLKREKVEEGAKKIAGIAKAISKSFTEKTKVDIVGPAEAPIQKLKGRYRWQLILKGKDVGSLHAVAKDVLSQNREKGIDIRVDVDPVNFM